MDQVQISVREPTVLPEVLQTFLILSRLIPAYALMYDTFLYLEHVY